MTTTQNELSAQGANLWGKKWAFVNRIMAETAAAHGLKITERTTRLMLTRMAWKVCSLLDMWPRDGGDMQIYNALIQEWFTILEAGHGSPVQSFVVSYDVEHDRVAEEKQLPDGDGRKWAYWKYGQNCTVVATLENKEVYTHVWKIAELKEHYGK